MKKYMQAVQLVLYEWLYLYNRQLQKSHLRCFKPQVAEIKNIKCNYRVVFLIIVIPEWASVFQS